MTYCSGSIFKNKGVEMSEVTQEKRFIKGPQDFTAGAVMVIFGALAYYFSRELPLGKGANLGPGSFPFGVSILIVLLGGFIAVNGILKDGQPLERWSWRGLVFILGSICVFAATIRPLGLLVSGPLLIVLSSFAMDEKIDYKELAIFTIGMTLSCIGLFKFALKQPIPVIGSFLERLF
jgi:Tripartite tricarboxylate transporter TctB family